MSMKPDDEKTCGCCGRVYRKAAWDKLPLVGIQPIPGFPSLELRNCPCKSTLAVERHVTVDDDEAAA